VIVALRYHVPASQTWAGSRGRQRGKVHVHVEQDYDHGRIHRRGGEALCGRRGWYEREADGDDLERAGICPRCDEIAARDPSLVPGLLP
jgi:hypothetical protein